MPDALVERDGPLMIVTMNRPHRKNAQSGAMLCRMYDAWVEASTDDDIRCIILTGAERNFSSGADLRAMAGDSGPHADTEIDVATRMKDEPRLMHKASNTLYEDAMIAATARVHQLTVVTRNVGDFKTFGVDVLNPFAAARK